MDAFLDRPAGSLDAAVTFWSSVTGSTPEPQTDPAFVRLRTTAGDDWLEIQEVRDGPGGTHPDLWVTTSPTSSLAPDPSAPASWTSTTAPG